MNIQITELTIKGSVTHYSLPRWKESASHPEGGYIKLYSKKYKVPRVALIFKAKVDIDLIVNGTYLAPDGNKFVAISKNEIHNMDLVIDKFEIPTDLIFVGHPFGEGSGLPIGIKQTI